MSEALNVVSGRKAVPTGTPLPITPTSTPITGASVKAITANGSGLVYIGPSTVSATDYYLLADGSIEFDVVDLLNVYVLGSTSSLVVVYFGLRA